MMTTSVFAKKRALVIGMGVSGRSVAEFLLAHGALVHGVDRNAYELMEHLEIQNLKQSGFTFGLEKDCEDLTPFDFIVLSPGISLEHPLVVSAKKKGLPVIGEIELGCQYAKNQMIGVTGTNGKTTVTLLITHVLKCCGFPAHALGNVGIPLTRELLHLPSSDSIVLELSSYQIETFYQPCLDSAIILNITPDHLDRYVTMEAYAAAKCMIERCLKPDGQLYMEESAWHQYGHLLKEKTPRLYGYSEASFVYTDLQSVFCQGKKRFDLPRSLQHQRSHELENLLAAYAICEEKGILEEKFLEAWQSFKKPPHRIEFVKECRGVYYYDDSKGTNIDAVIRAVQSLKGPIILIAGGMDKGTSYLPWIEGFRDRVKSICVIGQAAGKIRDQLASHFSVEIFSSLDAAVHQAAQCAEKGDYVLLSPGCSSLDMFTSYIHRGKEFQRIVCELEAERRL